jgi:hypothetical protein
MFIEKDVMWFVRPLRGRINSHRLSFYKYLMASPSRFCFMFLIPKGLHVYSKGILLVVRPQGVVLIPIVSRSINI